MRNFIDTSESNFLSKKPHKPGEKGPQETVSFVDAGVKGFYGNLKKPWFKRIPDHPGIFIRMDEGMGQRSQHWNEREYVKYKKAKEITPPELEEIIKRVSRARKIFKEMENFGINIPQFDTVIGADEHGNVRTYTVVEHVEGKPVSLISSEREFFRTAASGWARTLVAFSNYLFEKYKNGEDYWDDGVDSQCVYGKAPKDKVDKLYMVDIGDDTIVWKDIYGPLLKDRFEYALKLMITNLNTAGYKFFNNPDQFLKEITQIKDIIDALNFLA
jgi:hypothetical protein